MSLLSWFRWYCECNNAKIIEKVTINGGHVEKYQCSYCGNRYNRFILNKSPFRIGELVKMKLDNRIGMIVNIKDICFHLDNYGLRYYTIKFPSLPNNSFNVAVGGAGLLSGGEAVIPNKGIYEEIETKEYEFEKMEV